MSVVKKFTRKVATIANQIPDSILGNQMLKKAIARLPENYNFEIYKSLWQIEKNQASRVALQFPEGLLMYSCIISDILEEYGNIETVIMGDVTYGACCVDDFTARALGCDFMIHYGHSCLVPVDVTSIKTLYVFVEIGINVDHFLKCITSNLKVQRLLMVSTVQFLSSLHFAKDRLEESGYSVTIPQARPLSKGEILGCTAPKVTEDYDCVLYLGDGRFHLEAIMIANPTSKAYRYDPYSKVFSEEFYNHDEMHQVRQTAIEQSRNKTRFGLILGTLGRQGSPKIYEKLVGKLKSRGFSVATILLSEISPQKLALFDRIEVFVQIACPRLSIDWGYAFPKPLLTPYEANVLLNEISWQSVYPMDFYSKQSLGDWTVNFQSEEETKLRLRNVK